MCIAETSAGAVGDAAALHDRRDFVGDAHELLAVFFVLNQRIVGVDDHGEIVARTCSRRSSRASEGGTALAERQPPHPRFRSSEATWSGAEVSSDRRAAIIARVYRSTAPGSAGMSGYLALPAALLQIGAQPAVGPRRPPAMPTLFRIVAPRRVEQALDQHRRRRNAA